MTTLVAWLWQGLAIAAVASLLVHAMPRLNAATRHAIWWSALAMVLVHPWTSAVFRSQPGLIQSAGPTNGSAAAALLLPPPPDWLALAAIAMWGGLVAFNLWRFSAGILFVIRIKRSSRPLAQADQARLPLWTSVRGSGRRAELRVSDTAPTPCALGLGRPAILIPAVLLSTLSERELDLIVMHEHAHLARRDDWLRLLQCALAVVVGVHPAVRLITRQIDLEREAACDDRVVLRTGDARVYAQCLATVASLSPRVNRVAMAVAPHAVRSESALRARVIRLLDRQADRTARLAPSATIVSLTTLAVAVFAAGHLPSLIAIDELRAEVLAPLAVRLITAADFGSPVGAVEPPAVRPETPVAPLRSNAGIAAVQPTVRAVSAPVGIEPEANGPAPVAPVPPPPVESRTLPPTLTTLAFGARIDRAETPEVSADSGTDWAANLAASGIAAGQDAKRVGLTVGSSSRRAGESIGRFFTRAGKSVAGK